MPRVFAISVPCLVAMLLASIAAAQPAGPSRIPWSQVAPGEQQLVRELLEAPDWPFRVFGLLRLERYAGMDDLVLAALDDDAWPVRCFAIHQASRFGLAIPADRFAAETSPAVVRAALRAGVDLPDEFVEAGARRLLRTKSLDELLLGLEIAAASDIDDLRRDAVGRLRTLIRNMDDSVAAVAGRRLAAIFQLPEAPATAGPWRNWLANQGRTLALPPPGAARSKPRPASLASQLEPDALGQLLIYLRALRQRDLDLVIVMDATMSMLPMINEARAGVDSLVVFLNDLSKSMRLAFVAYRDHDNAPVWEGQRFTTDVKVIRDFLFGLRITGGADYPEAVLDGVAACEKLEWNRQAVREIIVVGDAPPHEADLYKLHALIESYRNHGVTLHTVHVPMRRSPDYLARLSPAARDMDARWIVEYNQDTAKLFGQMAETGGGRSGTLADAAGLVPAVMHFTIEEAWWPVFDEFYELYVELCR